MRYYVALERGESNWSAFVPDLPGVAVTGATREEVLELARGAIELHLEGLREDGVPIPAPTTGEYFDVAVA